jgi:hypothetical protein
MFRSIARVAISAGIASVFVLASLANAQPGMPNPTTAAESADDLIHF